MSPLRSALPLLFAAALFAPRPSPGASPAAAASPEVNALLLSRGAFPYSDEEGRQFSWEAAPLADGRVDGQDTWWEPRKDGPTVSATFRLAEPYDLVRAEVVNSDNERGYPGISTKRMRLEAGAGPAGPWKVLAEVGLGRGRKPQPLSFPRTPAVRYLRVTLLENYGNEEWWSLAELAVLGAPSKTRAIRYDGAWNATYGEMVLKQEGQRVTGCYATSADEEGRAGDSTVEGIVEDGIFYGTWVEWFEGNREPARGTFAFALTAEGELSGVWGTDAAGKDRTSRWEGTPKEGRSRLNCARPESSLAKDLSDGRAVLRGILFDTGLDVIRPESVPVLEALAAALRTDAKRRYVIEGHTDDRGGAAANQVLSDKRAASVKAWLVRAGIPDARLETKGYGQGKPAQPNDTPAGRAANRRVEVAVLP